MVNFNLVIALDVLMSIVVIYGSGSNSAVQKCGISYRKIGCFADKRRPFPNLMLNERKSIDWQNWNEFLESFVCQCANRTTAAGYSYFGIQFWGECWSGKNPDVAYDSDGQSNVCIGRDFLPCASVSSSCAGVGHVNYVYRIEVDQSSDACQGQDHLLCQKYMEFCDSYEHVAKMCPRTCKSCRG